MGSRLAVAGLVTLACAVAITMPKVVQRLEGTPATVHASEGHLYAALIGGDTLEMRKASLAVWIDIKNATLDGDYSERRARAEFRQLAGLTAQGGCLRCGGFFALASTGQDARSML